MELGLTVSLDEAAWPETVSRPSPSGPGAALTPSLFRQNRFMDQDGGIEARLLGVDLGADSFAAEDIDNHVQVEEHSADTCRQIRDVPRLHLVRPRGTVAFRRRARPGLSGCGAGDVAR